MHINKIDDALRKRKLTKQKHLQTDGQINVNTDSQTGIKTEKTEPVSDLLGLYKVFLDITLFLLSHSTFQQIS